MYQKGWLGEFWDDEEVQRRHLIENIQAVTGQDARILEEMTNEELVGKFRELETDLHTFLKITIPIINMLVWPFNVLAG